MAFSITRHQRPLLFVLILFTCFNISAKELIFSAAPRESVAQGHKLYTPLADYLSKLLGTPVKYQHAKHWLRYQNNIRKKKYDIVFDGPHLASWRIKHINHQPLVKLPGKLGFYMISKADNEAINTPEDLIYKRVCAIPPPNLTAITLLQRLNDPVKEPVLVSVKGGMGKIYKKLTAGGCEGAVIRSDFYHKKLTDKQRAKIKIIYTSPEMPNQVITITDKISEQDREKLVSALTQVEGLKITANIVKRFGGKDVKGFVGVSKNEYIGYSGFLEGVVLGW